MRKKSKRNFNRKAFTLAELIMAMWVMVIILTAVASLAFALGVANDSADDTAEFQSRLRFTTLKINSLVKNSRLICGNEGFRVAVWRNDDNGDGKINPGELVYIEHNRSTKEISLLEFECEGWVAELDVSIDDIADGSLRFWLAGRAVWNYTVLMKNCSGLVFTTDVAAPFSKKMAMKFSFQRDGSTQYYEINSSLRCYAGHLLNASGEIVSDDDE